MTLRPVLKENLIFSISELRNKIRHNCQASQEVDLFLKQVLKAPRERDHLLGVRAAHNTSLSFKDQLGTTLELPNQKAISLTLKCSLSNTHHREWMHLEVTGSFLKGQ